jgi:hypothetical protein
VTINVGSQPVTGLPAGAVKTCIQLVTSTVHVYYDSASRHNVDKVLRVLLEKYGAVAAKSLAAVCASSFAAMRMCTVALTSHVSVFNWTCLLLASNQIGEDFDVSGVVCRHQLHCSRTR